MDRLPNEIVFQILHCLNSNDVVRVQAVCQRFASLGRDRELWKTICFDHSRGELARRRHDRLASQEAHLAALRRAMTVVSTRSHISEQDDNANSPRQRALAQWDPSRPNHAVDFYQEFIQRHSPARLDWLQRPFETGSRTALEAMGVGTFLGKGGVDKVVSPLEDGSICIWEMRSDSSPSERGRIVAQSPPILLSQVTGNNGSAAMARTQQEIGAIENVAIDSWTGRAYIAIANELVEVDLRNQQVVRSQPFPFTISCLSRAVPFTPITVGTTSTIHVYDTRSLPSRSNMEDLVRVEPINISASLDRMQRGWTDSHAVLSQPGPLSILHMPPAETNDIWICGRFTSLLNYDIRTWPRIRGTKFSGARLSSLCATEEPYVPRDFNLLTNKSISIGNLQAARSEPGNTLIAAGEYRGKGSLELYDCARTTEQISSDLLQGMRQQDTSYRNRQTASKSRLLSVTPYGSKLAFSDGDGRLKIVEMDGSTTIREININGIVQGDIASASIVSTLDSPELDGDIAQKITPTNAGQNSSVNQNDLLIWTGEGRLGLVNFRARPAFFSDQDLPTVSDEDKRFAQEAEDYEKSLRQALERQAQETRYVRGLGHTMRVG